MRAQSGARESGKPYSLALVLRKGRKEERHPGNQVPGGRATSLGFYWVKVMNCTVRVVFVERRFFTSVFMQCFSG